MADQTIKCPKCGYNIPITEAFTRQIEEQLRRDFDAELKRRQQEFDAALTAKDKEIANALARERAARRGSEKESG